MEDLDCLLKLKKPFLEPFFGPLEVGGRAWDCAGVAVVAGGSGIGSSKVDEMEG